MNFEDDSSEDYYEDWDYEDPEEEDEDIEESENFKLQNNCADLCSAIKEYTRQLHLPLCQYLNPQKIYEFTQKYKSSS